MVVLLFFNGGGVSQALPPAGVQSGDRIQIAFEILKRLPVSKKLITGISEQLRLKESEALETLFQWSTVSRTNAVLTRYYNLSTGEEHRDRQVTIYLKRNQTLASLVLDISHELTHALSAPAWDPYDPELTAGKYLMASLEGPGGEVDALMVECQVAFELSEKYGVPLTRCDKYQNKKNGKIERQKIRADFYQVGSWVGQIKNSLGEEVNGFPLLNGQKPSLYSSTGKAPYPVALLREYSEMTRIACENTRSRLKRAPSENSRDSTTKFLSHRCQGMSIASSLKYK